MTEETTPYNYPTERWDKIQDVLTLAKCVGVLARCTCNEPLLDWRGELCGYCQVEESIVVLAELRARSEKQLEACQAGLAYLDNRLTSLKQLPTSKDLMYTLGVRRQLQAAIASNATDQEEAKSPDRPPRCPVILL